MSAAKKDTLFLLLPDFEDGDGGPWYCPWCARIEGVLGYYPRLSSELDVARVRFPRPRAEIVALLGEQHQSCPVLVLADDATWPAAQMSETGRSFLKGDEILHYLAERYGVARPHP